jgi:hypothetical protein
LSTDGHLTFSTFPQRMLFGNIGLCLSAEHDDLIDGSRSLIARTAHQERQMRMFARVWRRMSMQPLCRATSTCDATRYAAWADVAEAEHGRMELVMCRLPKG